MAETSPKQEIQSVFMTYNIRYANPNDGQNVWENRKDNVANLVLEYNPEIIGFQEALLDQVAFLETNLSEYGWVGVGRDDGENQGEFSPIFFKRETMELLRWDSFWLSENPESSSVGWDAALPRICTWAQFSILGTNQSIYYFNTHFDHKGEKARTESSSLILDMINSICNENDIILLGGDFNYTDKSDGYMRITSQLDDTKNIANIVTGPDGTFVGFEPDQILNPDRIDYIFSTGNVRVLEHKTIADQFNGLYPSDHLPVLCRVSITP